MYTLGCTLFIITNNNIHIAFISAYLHVNINLFFDEILFESPQDYKILNNYFVFLVVKRIDLLLDGSSFD